MKIKPFKKENLKILGICILLTSFLLSSCAGTSAKKPAGQKTVSDYKITVVFNDYKTRDDLKGAFGFACMVQENNKNILFDTGGVGDILIYNMKVLGFDPSKIDILYISHNHEDHTGGMRAILPENPRLPVYLPANSINSLGRFVDLYKGKTIAVSEDAVNIQPGIISSGIEPGPSEQSMILDTNHGLIIITGCAHPGVVNIVKRAEEITGKKTLLLMGGFHLNGTSDEDIRKIISQLKDLGVVYVAPSHCTGSRAINMFRESYGEFFLESGAGHVVTPDTFPDNI